MVKQLKVKANGSLSSLVFEKYNNLSSFNADKKQSLAGEIGSVLADCWGKFNDEFIEKHVLAASRLIAAKVDKQCVGFCVLSFKRICSINVHYVEFLVVKRAFQRSAVGQRLFYLIILDDVKNNLLRLLFRPLEIMFITPSIRALAQMARFAGFIYPDPRLAGSDGSIPPADELTWKMAQELIKQSDKPDRRLCREGLVLEGSYAETPWLVYGPEDAPWVNDFKMTNFAKRYLGYQNKEDKELVVRAHLTLASITRYEILYSR